MIQTAIVGLGRAGQYHHLRTIKALPHLFHLTGLCDSRMDIAKAIASREGLRVYPSYEDLLADRTVELVVLATRSCFHYEQTVSALKAGKAVLCEKPMATTYEEALEMVRAAERYGRPLCVFHNSRYADDYLTVKRVIDSGELGRVFCIRMLWNGFNRRRDWQSFLRYGGGVLLNTAPHPVDLALQLLGPNAAVHDAYATTIFSADGAPDHAAFHLADRLGERHVHLEVSHCDAYGADLRWHLLGTDGGLFGSGRSFQWRTTSPLEAELATRPLTPDDASLSPALEWQERAWCEADDTKSERFYRAFHHAYRQEGRALIPPEEALRVMEVIGAASSR